MSLLAQLTPWLENATKDWQATDFAVIDQLHTGGLQSTQALIQQWPLSLNSPLKKGLDMGCGLGGTARAIVNAYKCHVTGTDINVEYIQAAKLLNAHINPTPPCDFLVADSLALPFANQHFDFIVSQHAMMNIANKPALFKEIARVLQRQGTLLLHEIFITDTISNTINYPTPWAMHAKDSHLQTWAQAKQQLQNFGFVVTQHEELTAQALQWLVNMRQSKHQTKYQAKHQQNSTLTTKKTNTAFHISKVLGKDADLMSQHLQDALQTQKIEVHAALLTYINDPNY